MFVILTILFAIATAVCAIGWIKHKVVNNLLLKYMLYKGCNLPTEEDIEKCADMTVQELVTKRINGGSMEVFTSKLIDWAYEAHTAKICKLRPDAQIPTAGSAQAAGYDLYACMPSERIIPPGGTVMIGTGLSIAPPPGYFGAVFARSGWATKRGLRPANCVGVCDEDYRGEYMVALHNDSPDEQIIHPGDRIAQLVFLPYMKVDFQEVDSLDSTDRGAGGFGSTGN